MNKTKATTQLAAMAAGLLAASTVAQAQTAIHQWNFNEASGTTAVDSIGGANATLLGAASFNGSGVTLDGTTGTYINLGANLLSSLTSATFEGWFSYSVPNDNVHLFSFDDGTGTGTSNGGGWNGNYVRYNVYASGNAGGLSYAEVPNVGNPYNTGNAGDGKVNGTTVLSQNSLHHVAFVYDSVLGIESIYVDGLLETSVVGTVTALSNLFDTRGSLGTSPWDAWGDKTLTGNINQFAIYDGALTAEQVAANFAAGPVPEPSTAALGILGTALLGFYRRSRAH
jgi:hypothetical protein